MQLTIVEPSFAILVPPTRETLKLIELCGRTCYQSQDRITDESASKFVRRLRESKHESVLEHAVATVRFVCSRSCSHQLVRHRIAAYSQESQRYVNCSKKGFQFISPTSLAIPPGVYEYPFPCDLSLAQCNWILDRFKDCMEYEVALKTMKPEDARECLPNAIKTEIVATYNLRAWRHVFKERCAKAAQAQIRNLMRGVLHEFNKVVPEVFDDLVEDLINE